MAENYVLAKPEEVSVDQKPFFDTKNMSHILWISAGGTSFGEEIKGPQGENGTDLGQKQSYLKMVHKLCVGTGSWIKVSKDKYNKIWLEPVDSTIKDQAKSLFDWDGKPGSVIESIEPNLVRATSYNCNEPAQTENLKKYELPIRIMGKVYQTINLETKEDCLSYAERFSKVLDEATRANQLVKIAPSEGDNAWPAFSDRPYPEVLKQKFARDTDRSLHKI